MDSEITHTTTLYDWLGWLDVNRKRVIQVAIGLAALALVVAFFIWRSGQKEVEASEAFIAMQLNAGRMGATRADELKRFTAEYGSSRVGPYALLLAGVAAYTNGQYAEARSAFEQFLAKTEDNPLAVQASYGIASSFEAEGRSAEALVKYEALARLSRESLADPAKLAMARIQIAQGKPDAALKLYQQLGENPASSASAEARLRAEQLIQKFPQLAPTNTPPNASPPIMLETPPAVTIPK